MQVPYFIVVEPPEYERYAAVIDKAKILQLPFADLGQGSIPARNWIWEHSIKIGAERHWILDDNIRNFYRLHKNIKYRLESGTGFRVIEDFVDRYENVALAGMQYHFFAPHKSKHTVLILNTRIYSCILIKNDLSFRWRGRYNEDTDLSLRVLKAGWCTVLFYIFLAEKNATMRMRGGNTDELYQGDGRRQMALSLHNQHPRLVKVVQKWGRWQHSVNYRPFKKNRLKKKSGVIIPRGVNNYGLVFVDKKTDRKWNG